jgi:localization factor PodJL
MPLPARTERYAARFDLPVGNAAHAHLHPHVWLQGSVMPSSDRPAPSRDRPEREGAPREGERAKTPADPIQPPQYFDPAEPWDSQSAEALTRLYESGEGFLHRQPEDKHARRWQPPQTEAPAPPPADEPGGLGSARLEARIAEIADRLQGSLAGINPDKAVAHLNHRLDAIEERFNEALSQVAQRSDLDGLKLIEAHVMELAAHVEQTRGRFDRIDAIDEQMQGLARRLEDGDHRRLDALEKLLQDYVAEWRKGEERTASALRSLEDVVNRVGESIETMEAQKPVPDLSLSLLGRSHLGGSTIESDPLSQVYADAARVLEPVDQGSPLDAADYMPKTEPAAVVPPAQSQAQWQGMATPAADPRKTDPTGDPLPAPSFRALAMRAKMRQAQLLGAESEPGEEPAEPLPDPAPEADAAARPTPRRARSSWLLAGGITLFAAIGYLLVDVFMTTSVTPLRPSATEQSARTPEVKAAAAPTAVPRAGEQPDVAHSASPADGIKKTPTIDSREMDPAPSAPRVARIDAIGSVMAAAFRNAESPHRPPVESTASIHLHTSSTQEPIVASVIATLPMTVGPASLRQAALRGDPAAQLEVASRFAAGHGVARDLVQAFHWYGRAAAQGSAVAQYRFGALYERGLGTARDPERARAWYMRASEQGNVKAMHNLAVLSVSGGRSDYSAAAKWFAQAADFGLTDSQVNLAILYQSGLGVPKDLTQAYKWLTLAARGGDREAAGRAAQVRALLRPADVQTADAGVSAWRARVPDAGANDSTAAALLEPGQ